MIAIIQMVWHFGALLSFCFTLITAQYIEGAYNPDHVPISSTCGSPGLKDWPDHPGINGWNCASSFEAEVFLEYDIVKSKYGPPENLTIDNQYIGTGAGPFLGVGVLTCTYKGNLTIDNRCEYWFFENGTLDTKPPQLYYRDYENPCPQICVGTDVPPPAKKCEENKGFLTRFCDNISLLSDYATIFGGFLCGSSLVKGGVTIDSLGLISGLIANKVSGNSQSQEEANVLKTTVLTGVSVSIELAQNSVGTTGKEALTRVLAATVGKIFPPIAGACAVKEAIDAVDVLCKVGAIAFARKRTCPARRRDLPLVPRLIEGDLFETKNAKRSHEDGLSLIPRAANICTLFLADWIPAEICRTQTPLIDCSMTAAGLVSSTGLNQEDADKVVTNCVILQNYQKAIAEACKIRVAVKLFEPYCDETPYYSPRFPPGTPDGPSTTVTSSTISSNFTFTHHPSSTTWTRPPLSGTSSAHSSSVILPTGTSSTDCASCRGTIEPTLTVTQAKPCQTCSQNGAPNPTVIKVPGTVIAPVPGNSVGATTQDLSVGKTIKSTGDLPPPSTQETVTRRPSATVSRLPTGNPIQFTGGARGLDGRLPALGIVVIGFHMVL